MAKQVYARLDDDRIEQMDTECEKRGVSRARIVGEAVEMYLETEEKLVQQREEFRDARDAAVKQRNKFKEKFEKAVQTNEVLLAKIRDLQGKGLFGRASGLKRINTDTYRISGGSK